MDIELAEVRESIAKVLEEQSTSLAVHAFIDGRDPLDQRLHELAAELGWLMLAPPESHGGLGLGAAGLAVLHQELGRAAAPGAFLATSVALEVLVRSPAAGEPAVAGLIAGALAGTTRLALAARLEAPRGDAPVRLLGAVDSAAALVAGEGDDVLLLDLAGADRQRVSLWDETRTMIAASLTQAATIATLPGARPLLEGLYAIALAADSAGAMRGILDRTVAYMKEREQFGRPIGSFQALKHRAADHLVAAYAAEQLVRQAVEHVDGSGPGARLWPAMAKANVTDAAARVAGDCIQLHGGVGYTREYDPHLFASRIRLNEALLAPNGQLRDRAEAALGLAVEAGDDVLEIA